MSTICMNCPPSMPTKSLGMSMDSMLKRLTEIIAENEVATTPTISVTSSMSRQEELISEIFEIYSECHKGNWDDDSAKAITREAVSEAISFIEGLPSNLDLPEVVASSDGAYDFEWYSDKGRFNVELYGKGKIVYAGYFSENNRDYGTKPYKNSIPDIILKGIERFSS